MARWIVMVLLIGICSVQTSGQNPPEVDQNRLLISTYPIRFIYGPNLQVGGLFRNQQQLAVHYQFHQRDFFSIRQSDDVLGFSAIPRLLDADGYTLYASYLFPTRTKQIWLGPKLGVKKVNGFLGEEEGYPDIINQSNLYALLNGVYRTKNKGFFFELYAQAGMVFIERKELEYINGQLDNFQEITFALPHILVGCSVGFGI
jgi:hypothetical protein